MDEEGNLVEKIENKKIKIKYRSPEAIEETIVVDLSKEKLKDIDRLALGKN